MREENHPKKARRDVEGKPLSLTALDEFKPRQFFKSAFEAPTFTKMATRHRRSTSSIGKLGQDLKRSRPFESRHQEVVISVLRTNELFQHQFGKLFRKHGLTQAQYNVLRILKGAKTKLPSLEIASRMITVVPAITRILDTLEKSDWIIRERSQQDRRVWLVHISKAGESLLKEIHKPNLELHHALVGHLTEREAAQLLKLLDKARFSQRASYTGAI